MLQPKDRAEYNRQKALEEQPIYRVIADFPDNKDFPVGDTITLVRWRVSDIYWAYKVKDCQGEREYLSDFFDKYPHIFKRVKYGEESKEQVDSPIDLRYSEAEVVDRWIGVENEPEFGGEYNVLYDLSDGGSPVVSTMDFDKNEHKWFDTRGANIECTTVIKWQPLPTPPLNSNHY
jgi:hypothetical protein